MKREGGRNRGRVSKGIRKGRTRESSKGEKEGDRAGYINITTTFDKGDGPLFQEGNEQVQKYIIWIKKCVPHCYIVPFEGCILKFSSRLRGTSP